MPSTPDTKGTLFRCEYGTPSEYLLMSESATEHLGVTGHQFWLLDENANIVDEFGPRFDCDCEYSFHTVYELRDGTLLQFFGKENDCRIGTLRHWKVEIVCQVDRELPPNEPDAAKIFERLEVS